ncbi:MAG: MG2 domain-containing protein, partial [Bacteroidota bacterium]
AVSNENTKGVGIENFKPILTEGRNEEGLRPTLYDFLAHRAIDFFMNERTYLTQPAYKFYIDDAQAFAKAEDFIKWQITSKDTASQKLQTLRLMQKLLAFRMQERERHSASLLDADLKRLRFVHQNAVIDTKDELYMRALQDLQKKYEDSPLVAEVKYEIASFYFTKGSDWQPLPLGSPSSDSPSGVGGGGGDDRKWHWKKALDLCNEVLQKHPGTFGAKQCSTLKASLLEKTLTMQTEVVNLPGEPFLARIDARNIPTVYLKIIRFNEKRRAELDKIRFGNNADDEMLQFFNKLKPLKSWSVKLPDDGDLRQHSVEIKMDKLPLGQYLVMVSPDAKFSKPQVPNPDGNLSGATGYLFTNVSNIGSWQRQHNEDGAEFVVFDRKNGTPLKGVTGELFWQNYNSVFRKYEWKKGGSGTSDADGILRPQASDREGRSYQVLFKLGKDTLFTGEGYYNYTYRDNPQRYQTTHFFTDRAIYRPGQTVFFKGIALEFDEKRMPAILKNKQVTVTFRDANYQEVSKLELKSNEYGSFSGQFTAPRTGLLGQMQIQSSIGGNAHSFRVEEYKRPKFEVTFEPVKGSYRLSEKITMQGKAMAYAGSNVDGAMVTWRVVREVRFPWLPWWMMRWFPQRGETMEIANGEAATDAEGKFSFQFTALPDRSIPKEQKPEFSYTVYADVTDITGETQSQEAYVSVGYVSLRADAVPAKAPGKPLASGSPGAPKTFPSDPPSGAGGGDVNLDSLKKFVVNIENLNGEPEPAQGTLTVELLQAPQTIFLSRFWEKPDRQVMSEKDFKKEFSQFAYAGEDRVENWKVERQVFEAKFDTKDSKEVLLPKVLLSPGKYVVTLRTKDKYGEAVEVKKYYTFYRLTDAGVAPGEKKVAGGEVRPPVPMIGWHLLENQNFEPGETARLYFASSEKSLPILLEIEKDGRRYLRKWITVGALQDVKYLVKEEDRGNLSYHVNFAKNNRSFNQSNTILIPWSNKDLRIEYGTFRDKLKPGQQEEWVLKIKGAKGEKVAAEMVAGMYDASLDLFAANSWGMSVFPSSWQRIRYSAESYNAVQNQWVGYFQPEPAEGDYREYEQLNWFNWYFAEGRPVMLMKSIAGGVRREKEDGFV